MMRVAFCIANDCCYVLMTMADKKGSVLGCGRR